MTQRQRPSSRRGFTLIEVLATMTLMGITLPVLMNGISIATHCADIARHRNEATALADSKLTEILSTTNWQSGGPPALSGDFGPDWPDYRWTATVGDWTESGLEQIDLHVSWRGRDGDREVVVTTLAYNGANAGPGTSGSTSSSGNSGTGGSSKGSTGSGGTGSSGSSGGAK